MRIFICEELINNLESNINKIKEIQYKLDSENYEAYFIYAFALFESGLSEIMKHILKAFPEKMNSEKQPSLTVKDIYSNIFFPQEIFDILVENEIKKVTKGSAKTIVEKAEYICAVKLTYDAKRLDDISAIRNRITHENTPSKQNNLYRDSKQKVEIKIMENCKEDIAYLIGLLTDFSLRVTDKYNKYTKYKMLKEFWNTLFDTPLLRFEDCVFIREDGMGKSKVVGLNFDYIEKASNSISSSEKFFLSILFQQYSQSINERFFKFSDIPMLVSILDKEKIYVFLHVMAQYPYLFNGMSFEESH